MYAKFFQGVSKILIIIGLCSVVPVIPKVQAVTWSIAIDRVNFNATPSSVAVAEKAEVMAWCDYTVSPSGYQEEENSGDTGDYYVEECYTWNWNATSEPGNATANPIDSKSSGHHWHWKVSYDSAATYSIEVQCTVKLYETGGGGIVTTSSPAATDSKTITRDLDVKPYVFHAAFSGPNPNNELWYFNGGDAANYPEGAQLWVSVDGESIHDLPTGQYHWEITQAKDSVDITRHDQGNWSNEAWIDVPVDSNYKIDIRTTNPTVAGTPIIIECHTNGVQICTASENVLAPETVQILNSTDNRAGDSVVGYETVYKMKVKDNHGNAVPAPLEISEDFGNWHDCYAAGNVQDWGTGDASGTITGSESNWTTAEFADHYAITRKTGRTPDPVYPYNTGWKEDVNWASQEYRAGSQDPMDPSRPIELHYLIHRLGSARQSSTHP